MFQACWYTYIKVFDRSLSPCRTPHLVPGKVLESRRAWLAPPSLPSQWAVVWSHKDIKHRSFWGPKRREKKILKKLRSKIKKNILGEGKTKVAQSVVKETRSLGKEQSVPRRKVTQPSVGISLNSWGNPPTSCLCASGGGQGGVCVLMCVNVCVCLGGGGPEL